LAAVAGSVEALGLGEGVVGVTAGRVAVVELELAGPLVAGEPLQAPMVSAMSASTAGRESRDSRISPPLPFQARRCSRGSLDFPSPLSTTGGLAARL